MLRYYPHRQTCNRTFLLPYLPRKTYLQMRFIHDVSPETRSLLHRLYKQSQHHRVRQRAHCIVLSSQGITTTALMAIFSVDRITIYNWFDAWESYHFAGLYDKKRCGRPPKLTAEEQGKAQHYLEQHPRDIRKVVYLLEEETSKRVSTKTIKRLVKKTAMFGSASKRLPKKALIHNSMRGV
jgi:transposase